MISLHAYRLAQLSSCLSRWSAGLRAACCEMHNKPEPTGLVTTARCVWG